MSRSGIILLRILVAIGSLLLWHVLTTFPSADPILDPFFFSTPVDVIERTAKDIMTPYMWRDLYITLLETTLAFS